MYKCTLQTDLIWQQIPICSGHSGHWGCFLPVDVFIPFLSYIIHHHVDDFWVYVSSNSLLLPLTSVLRSRFLTLNLEFFFNFSITDIINVLLVPILTFALTLIESSLNPLQFKLPILLIFLGLFHWVMEAIIFRMSIHPSVHTMAPDWFTEFYWIYMDLFFLPSRWTI